MVKKFSERLACERYVARKLEHYIAENELAHQDNPDIHVRVFTLEILISEGWHEKIDDLEAFLAIRGQKLQANHFYIALLMGKLDEARQTFTKQSFRYVDCAALEEIKLRQFFGNPLFGFTNKKDLLAFCSNLLTIAARNMTEFISESLKNDAFLVRYTKTFFDAKLNLVTIVFQCDAQQWLNHQTLIKLCYRYRADIICGRLQSQKTKQVLRLSLHL